ncbi:MAG: Gfo/Idh/MocA family oxidoreductase, partial [Clostridia bacterium]|nr:Gfo/Idh/MocA family oxidoreductase [Clostridia bacterium]
QHLEHATRAMKLGYHLLLEKPIAANMQDVTEIYETSLREKRKVYVCHVLRYAPFYSVIKDELNSGKYGKIVTLNATENVGFWHQAHSFVRGNWAVTENSTPMIIAKCCHDLDLICWFMDEKCKSVSSFGSLSYFRKSNAPKGHTARCLGCPEQGKCAYDAEKIYITDRFLKGQTDWPVDVVANEPTEAKLRAALETGPYGRCVFECDNTAVDHQVVNMQFESGATAHLTMTAFSTDPYRNIHIHCEKGDIYGSMEEDVLHCNAFGYDSKDIRISEYCKSTYGHGGGDFYIVKDLVDELTGGAAKASTSIEKSVQSHAIGFAAEESRLQGGKVIEVNR